MMMAQNTMVVTAKDGSKTRFDVTKVNKVTWTDEKIPTAHEYVDLDLPSGTLWATTNVGAEKPEEVGLFIQWGDSQAYESDEKSFSWYTYKWCNNARTSLLKYNPLPSFGKTDDESWLQLADDAAYVNWGEDWRTPSKEQMEELMDDNYTKKEYIKQEKAYKLTSLKNGNSIYFPASGLCDGSLERKDDFYYWTRTLNLQAPDYAYQLIMGEGYYIKVQCDFSRRCGMVVRPVRR